MSTDHKLLKLQKKTKEIVKQGKVHLIVRSDQSELCRGCVPYYNYEIYFNDVIWITSSKYKELVLVRNEIGG